MNGTGSAAPACPPVVYLIFNRSEATRRSFERLRAVRPERLLIVADGPRPRVPEDAERCRLARAAATAVDWPCRVQTCFSETNLGLKKRVASGLDWAFAEVEEAVVVEDDCLIDPSFFRFAAEMLEAHRDDARVMCVSANNFQPGPARTPYSYYFSRYAHCWGWATWRRAWRHFDPGLARWPEIRDGGWLDDILRDDSGLAYWRGAFEGCFRGEINSWALAWNFACWVHGGLTILPEVNLVQNVGFGPDGTNTTSGDNHLAALAAGTLRFPLRPPPFVIRDHRADHVTQRVVYNPQPPPSLPRRIVRKLRRILGLPPA